MGSQTESEGHRSATVTDGPVPNREGQLDREFVVHDGNEGSEASDGESFGGGSIFPDSDDDFDAVSAWRDSGMPRKCDNVVARQVLGDEQFQARDSAVNLDSTVVRSILRKDRSGRSSRDPSVRVRLCNDVVTRTFEGHRDAAASVDVACLPGKYILNKRMMG